MRRPSVDAIFFFFQAEDGIRDLTVTGVHVCSSDLKSNTSDDAFALLAVVTNAESIGEEGPQSSPKERFDVVDKRLNDVYDKLIAKIEPAKRESIRNEQRAWLISRDTEAEIAALQMWSSGREATARILESKAISTEARVAELEKLLSGSQVK